MFLEFLECTLKRLAPYEAHECRFCRCALAFPPWYDLARDVSTAMPRPRCLDPSASGKRAAERLAVIEAIWHCRGHELAARPSFVGKTPWKSDKSLSCHDSWTMRCRWKREVCFVIMGTVRFGSMSCTFRLDPDVGKCALSRIYFRLIQLEK